MSAHHDAHAGHDDHEDDGIPHVHARDYVLGFVFSVLLTAVPFGLVMAGGNADPTLIKVLILALAAVQVVVHMVYFLHMSPKSEGGWNFLALLFTGVLVVIVLAGSLWVMFHLDTNMMPMTPHEMRMVP
ncbi:cytochrome o ubiquinol oxidase subunit IV [Dokdonella sp. MW10]|uniref:cytochrome o ubiquinol oxidase subunit IV n=1 Tax=Dokdonella sp. MW10 TaxID=2992926 RepID=UPI003F7E5CB2